MQSPQVSHLSVPCHIPVIPPKVIVFKGGWQTLSRTADVAWTPSPQEKISIESAFLISSSLGFILERMSAFWHRKSISITPVTFFPSFSSLSFVLARTAFPPVLAPSGQPPHPSMNIFLSSFIFISNFSTGLNSVNIMEPPKKHLKSLDYFIFGYHIFSWRYHMNRTGGTGIKTSDDS